MGRVATASKFSVLKSRDKQFLNLLAFAERADTEGQALGLKQSVSLGGQPGPGHTAGFGDAGMGTARDGLLGDA